MYLKDKIVIMIAITKLVLRNAGDRTSAGFVKLSPLSLGMREVSQCTRQCACTNTEAAYLATTLWCGWAG